jgi:hypothetical protein
MTDTALGNHYACDLCPRLRREHPRNLGSNWLDGYWVCVACLNLYCRKLVAAGGKVYVTRP